MDRQKFFGVFQEVLASDTGRVKAATATLKSEFYPLPESLSVLLELLVSGQPASLRQLAATQAKRLVPRHWKAISDDDKVKIRRSLLERALYEEEKLVKHGASRVIAAIAEKDLANSEWLDLVDILLRAGVDSNPRPREVSTYVLFALVDTAGETIMHKFQQILALFGKTINDPESAEVRINTMLALSRIAILLDPENDEETLHAIQAAIPHMVNVLKVCIDANAEDRTTQAFEVFQTLLSCESVILNPHFRDLVLFMNEISGRTEIGDDVRVQALSFLMQAVSVRKLKIQGLKLGERITLRCLEIVTELDEEDDDDDEMTPPHSALGLLTLLSANLPPAQVVVPLLHALGPYVNNHDPQRRQAGIRCLGTCVEGAPDFMATQIKEVLPLVLRLLNDSDPSVQRATVDCITQFSEELGEEISKEHQKLLPPLVKAIDTAISNLRGPEDEMNLEMIRSSCNAIDTIAAEMEQKEMVQYISELYPRMSRLFTHPDLKTKSAAIGAVGSIADCSKDDFLPYLERTMNALSGYVQMKDSDEEFDLRCIACDTIANIAGAVGAQPFQRYVRPMMSATEEAMHLDNPKLKETSFLFWGNLAKVYKTDFKPFLDGVVKALFESLESEESELEVDLGQEGADLAGKEVTIGGKKIKVAAMSDDEIIEASEIEDLNEDEMDDDDDDEWDDDLQAITAIAQEKEIAVEVVGDIVSHLPTDYVQYLEKTMEVILPLVEHGYEGVRRGAISTLFRIYAAVWELQPDAQKKWKPGVPVQVQPTAEISKIGELITTALLAIWPEEEDRNTVTETSRSLAATLKVTGPSLIASPTVLKPLTETLLLILQRSHPCQSDLGLDDLEIDDLDSSAEYDWLVIDCALDAIIALAIALGESYAELYKIFEKPIMKFASSSEHIERSTAVGAIAECIRAMGPAVTPFTSTLLKLLLHRLSDEDSETKSNAAFAIGLLQEKSQSDAEVLKAFPSILSKLEPMLQTEEARMTDNAAGCVSRMITRHQANVPVKMVLPALIDLLPLKEDYEENEAVWGMVVQLYSASDPTILSLTPQLLPVLEQVLSPPEEQLDDATRAQLAEMVKYIHGKYPTEVKKYGRLSEVAAS